MYDKGYTDKTNLKIETLSGIKYLDLHLSGGVVKTVTGNPHAVIFVDDIEKAPLTTLGPKIEHHSAFPGGVNVEFVQVLSDKELRMRVWERGSGVTMACGTGACASTMAAIEKKFCDYDTPISVHLDGGTLKIQIASDHTVIMTGPAEIIYEGETTT